MKQLILGIILDVSLQHNENQRLIDIIKDDIIDYFKKADPEDEFYIYDSEKIHYNNRGKQRAEVSNYQSPAVMDIDLAIKQTLYILANEDESNDRYVMYITDRYDPKNNSRIERILKSNEFNRFYCNFIFVEIGNKININHEYLKIKQVEKYKKGLFEEIIKEIHG